MTRRCSAVLLTAVLSTCSCSCVHMQVGADDAGALDASDGVDGGAPDAGRTCSAFGDSAEVAPFPKVLDELSGLAASRVNANVLYAHNDSGDSARFFAFSSVTGTLLGEFRLPGVSAADWEDIAVGPCPEGSCVYLADIGDNAQVRSGYVIYRVPEPIVTSDAPMPAMSVTFTALRFSYPEETKHNAEAFMVHPQTGDMYVITKERLGTLSTLFRYDASAADSNSVHVVDFVRTLPFSVGTDGQVTGADIGPTGRSVAVRLYNRILLFVGTANGAFADIFDAPRVVIEASNDEPQGEAICFAPDGSALFTGSEVISAAMSLHRHQCGRYAE